MPCHLSQNERLCQDPLSTGAGRQWANGMPAEGARMLHVGASNAPAALVLQGAGWEQVPLSRPNIFASVMFSSQNSLPGLQRCRPTEHTWQQPRSTMAPKSMRTAAGLELVAPARLLLTFSPLPFCSCCSPRRRGQGFVVSHERHEENWEGLSAKPFATVHEAGYNLQRLIP